MCRYEDNGIYVTEMVEESAASRSGLRVHDKILQLNGYDFTMVGYSCIFAFIFTFYIYLFCRSANKCIFSLLLFPLDR